jgi:hypothetical protein
MKASLDCKFIYEKSLKWRIHNSIPNLNLEVLIEKRSNTRIYFDTQICIYIYRIIHGKFTIIIIIEIMI